MNKKILNQLDDWQKRVKMLNNKKAKLEKEILMLDIDLFKMIARYDDLCRKLYK